MKAKGISFDYGHVLGGLDLDELASRIDRPRAPLDAAMPAAYAAHDRTIAEGRGHEAGWRALMRTLLVAANVDDVEPAIDRLWKAQPTRNLWRHVPEEARAMLRRLSDLRVPMVITSNSEGRVRELLEEVGIAHHFVAILDSGVLGISKPDARIFLLAAEALEVPIGSVVHVGDSEAADIVGAKNAGASAVRFDAFLPQAATNPTIADARASTFEELTEILSRALVRS
ncbi:MAG: HAD family hydrolase [Polyangiales bacterium]